MKIVIVEDGGKNLHLPHFCRNPGSGMLGSGLRHLGIEIDGEVVATVWNNHDSTLCRELSDVIAAALTAKFNVK